MAPVELSIIGGEVTHNGGPIDLSNGEFCVLAAIALQRGATCTAADATTILWPDSDPDAAKRLLRVFVHRIRRRLNRPDAILVSERGYRLGDGVVVDFFELGELVHRCRASKSVDDASREALLRANRRFQRGGYRRLRPLDIFDGLEQRILHLIVETSTLLANELVRAGASASALVVVEDALAVEPCSEELVELSLRLLIASGQRDAAVRRYRAFERSLKVELGFSPSPSLLHLVAN